MACISMPPMSIHSHGGNYHMVETGMGGLGTILQENLGWGPGNKATGETGMGGLGTMLQEKLG